MRKFKLIKEYPGSRNLGCIIIDEEGVGEYLMPDDDTYDCNLFTVATFDPGDLPEFWEEIKVKKNEKIKYLDEDLVRFINKYLPNLDWEGNDSSAWADMKLDFSGCIEWELMNSIGNAIVAAIGCEYRISIRPRENRIIIHYYD